MYAVVYETKLSKKVLIASDNRRSRVRVKVRYGYRGLLLYDVLFVSYKPFDNHIFDCRLL